MGITLCLLFLGLPVLSFSSDKSCSPLSTPQDVIACVQKNHPQVKHWEAQVQTIPGYEQSARQRPNPELEAEYLSQTTGGSGHEGETALLHTWETGGKRKARLSQAQAQARWILAQREVARKNAALQTLRGLTRLRHIHEELAVIEETIHTFDTILRQYRKRPRLSPEQTVSLSVFDLAKKDQVLQRAHLLQEQREWTSFFQLSLGENIEDRPTLWAPFFTQWPDAPQKDVSPGGAQRLVQEAVLEKTRAQGRLAYAESWPDVALGPRLSFGKDNGQTTSGLGANLSMDLPLFQRNKGGRNLSRAQTRVAASDLNGAEQKWQLQDATLRQTYQDTLALLKKMPSPEEIEQKHKELESLFARGLINSALVIEAHRQRSEWTQNRNTAEARALETLWALRALNKSSKEVQP